MAQVSVSPYQVGAPWSHFRGDLNYSGVSTYVSQLTNNTRWVVGSQNHVETSIAISAGDSLYITSYSESGFPYLTLMNSNGQTKWMNRYGDSTFGTYSSPAIASDGSIVFAFGVSVYNVSPTGSVNWIFETNLTDQQIYAASPSIMSGTLDVIIGTQSGYMLSINSIGSLNWYYQCIVNSAYIFSAAAIDQDNSIYFGSSDYLAYKISKIGEYIWTYMTANIVISSPAIGNDGSVYVTSCDGFVYKLNSITGNLIWKYEAGNSIMLSAAISPCNGDIYVSSSNNYMYSITTSGNLRWKFGVGIFWSSPPVVDANCNIFIASSTYLAVFGVFSNGTVIWNYINSKLAGFKSAPSIGSDGTLYIASDYGYSFAFGESNSAENTSPANDGDSRLVAIGLAAGGCMCIALIIVLASYSLYKKRLSDRFESGDYVILDEDDGKDKATAANEIHYTHGTSSTQAALTSSAKSIRVPKIRWSDIHISGQKKQCVVGQGSFGVVLKATWSPPQIPIFENVSQKDRIVAIKVLTRSVPGSVGNRIMNNDKVLRSAMNELQTMKAAEERMKFKDCIVKVHGIVSGKIPKSICVALNVNEGPEAIGIVMRFEGGGSLDSLIYERDSSKQYWPLEDKLRILTAIARGLAELHAVGVVHGDVKPDNVLLSDDNPPEVRLADFGLSTIKAETTVGLSSLSHTKHMRGSPIYCAPEILHNPFKVLDASSTRQRSSGAFTPPNQNLVAKPSRKTDVYSFALMTWEVLTEQPPFSEAENETMLCTMVHRGDRPLIDYIQKDCPEQIISMIQACWHTERSQRYTALECYSILSQRYNVIMSSHYDVFLSHDSNYLPSLTYAIYHRFTQHGLRVWFDSINKSSISASEAVLRSNTFVMVAGESYPNSDICMEHLASSRRTKPAKRLIPFLLKKNLSAWGTKEFLRLFQNRALAMNSTSYADFDLEEISQDASWCDEDGPNLFTLNKLHAIVDEVVQFIKDLDSYTRFNANSSLTASVG